MSADHELDRDAPEAAPAAEDPATTSEPAGRGLLGLQRAAGNRAVNSLLAQAQATLAVGHADDPLEREADSVATQVVQRLRSGRGGAALTASSEAPAIARTIRRRPKPSTADAIGPEGGDVAPDLERKLAAERTGGTPLRAEVRQDMEQAFGADFSGVRVHSGRTSEDLNRSLGANAFTVGRDIFFRGSAPDAGTESGQHLLAHELTHTVQQGAAGVSRTVQREAEETEGGETEGEEPSTSAAGVITGTLRNIETESESGEEESTSPPEGEMAETTNPSLARSPAARSPRPASTRPPPAGTTSYQFSVGSVGVSSSIVKTGDAAARRLGDAIVGNPTVNSTISNSYNSKAFGGMSPTWSIPKTTYAVETKKKASIVKVDFDLDILGAWGVDSGGKTDVPSPTDGVVKADNYEEIAEDLTPRTGMDKVLNKDFGKSWVARRQKYWARALTERHEIFHAKDVTGWTEKQGKKFATNYLKRKTVDLSEDDRKDATKVEAKMSTIMSDTLAATKAAGWVYLIGTGLTYYNYPCEVRAFGDGKAPYKKLADGVRKHGKKLAAAKKKADAEAAKPKPTVEAKAE